MSGGLKHQALTEQIIGAAIDVHRRLGPGFLESIYEKAMLIALGKHGLSADSQQEFIVEYAGVEVGKHILDLLVEDTVVVEIKAMRDGGRSFFGSALLFEDNP